jgi:hypothetical protein
MIWVKWINNEGNHYIIIGTSIMFGIPFIQWDQGSFLSGKRFGIVYELSKKDLRAIEQINEKRKSENRRALLRVDFWKLRNEEGRTRESVCARVIKIEDFKEYYEALDKIKPFSEREIVEVRG